MNIYKSYGKINLSLEVLSKRDDGYHNIDSIMNQIDLYDEMTFTTIQGDDLFLETNCKYMPTNSTNLVYKAWEILKPYYKGNHGLNIYINKNIPLASGLGGGTSNGVVTMRVLNEMWNLGFKREQLIELAKPLGADSTFFFFEDLVRVEGIGNKVTELGKIKQLPILLVNIGVGLSSKEVYESITEFSQGKVNDLIENIDNIDYVLQNSYNNMEDVSFKKIPQLKKIKEEIKELGAIAGLMSGAGPTIFGVFKNQDTRDQAYKLLKDKYNTVIKSKLK